MINKRIVPIALLFAAFGIAACENRGPHSPLREEATLLANLASIEGCTTEQKIDHFEAILLEDTVEGDRILEEDCELTLDVLYARASLAEALEDWDKHIQLLEFAYEHSLTSKDEQKQEYFSLTLGRGYFDVGVLQEKNDLIESSDLLLEKHIKRFPKATLAIRHRIDALVFLDKVDAAIELAIEGAEIIENNEDQVRLIDFRQLEEELKRYRDDGVVPDWADYYLR